MEVFFLHFDLNSVRINSGDAFNILIVRDQMRGTESRIAYRLDREFYILARYWFAIRKFCFFVQEKNMLNLSLDCTNLEDNDKRILRQNFLDYFDSFQDELDIYLSANRTQQYLAKSIEFREHLFYNSKKRFCLYCLIKKVNIY